MQTFHLAQLRKLAQLLDSKYTLPFGIKIGWDAIVGWVPVLGGILTTLVSGYIVVAGFQLGNPPSVLIRMLLNIVVDNLLASIPVLGWFLDVAYRSNLKNIALIESSFQHPIQTRNESRWILGSLLFVCFAVSVSLVLVASFTLVWLGQLILQSLQNFQ
jgi:hypothetical protein